MDVCPRECSPVGRDVLEPRTVAKPRDTPKPQTRTLKIQLLRHPKDWHASKEVSYKVKEGGDVDLQGVAVSLGIDGGCKVSCWVLMISMDE